jgi:hypothetical protein
MSINFDLFTDFFDSGIHFSLTLANQFRSATEKQTKNERHLKVECSRPYRQQ